MPIKEGLKKIEGWIAEMKKKHDEGDEKEKTYKSFFDFSEELQAYRKKRRRRAQAELVQEIVLSTNEERLKRTRSSFSSPEKEKKTPKKKNHGNTKEERCEPCKKPDGLQRTRKTNETAPRAPPKALLIKQGEGKSYADVLWRICKDVNPDVIGIPVLCTQNTTRGDILLRIGAGLDCKNFQADLRKVIGGHGVIKTIRKDVELKIRDLDSLTKRKLQPP